MSVSMIILPRCTSTSDLGHPDLKTYPTLFPDAMETFQFYRLLTAFYKRFLIHAPRTERGFTLADVAQRLRKSLYAGAPARASLRMLGICGPRY